MYRFAPGIDCERGEMTMEHSRGIALPMLPLPLLLLFLLLLQSMSCLFGLGLSTRLLGEANDADLITSTCRHTEYFDICMSTLQSYPDSRNADVKGLAAISLDACIAHAEETVAYVKQLMSGDASTTGPAGGGDEYESRCLDDCLTQYSDALDDLSESVGQLQRGDYDSVNSMVSAAMTDSDTCEGGFGERPGYNSPLTERNGYFSKLCSNSLAIAGLLSCREQQPTHAPGKAVAAAAAGDPRTGERCDRTGSFPDPSSSGEANHQDPVETGSPW